jgi:hypothetical protein
MTFIDAADRSDAPGLLPTQASCHFGRQALPLCLLAERLTMSFRYPTKPRRIITRLRAASQTPSERPRLMHRRP